MGFFFLRDVMAIIMFDINCVYCENYYLLDRKNRILFGLKFE